MSTSDTIIETRRLARAKGATMFEVGKTLYAVQQMYADDPHLDLIVEGWQEMVGKSAQNPRKAVDPYSPTSPISEMSVSDLNERVVAAANYLSFGIWVTVHFGRPLFLTIALVPEGTGSTRINTYEQLTGFLAGLTFADQNHPAQPRVETRTVSADGIPHGWECVQRHPPLLEGDPHTEEVVAAFPTLPGAEHFVKAVDGAWKMFTHHGWSKRRELG